MAIYTKPKKKTTKYHSKKSEYKGVMFDSKKEMNRFIVLERLEQLGEICNLRRQERLSWVEIHKYTNGKEICFKRAYIADFTYLKNGIKIYEDSKGYKTKEYLKKKKILLAFGISILET